MWYIILRVDFYRIYSRDSGVKNTIFNSLPQNILSIYILILLCERYLYNIYIEQIDIWFCVYRKIYNTHSYTYKQKKKSKIIH